MSSPFALLVDDDMIFTLWVTKLLQLEGFEVIKASNGHKALQLLENQSPFPEVIITDYQMPMMSGLELIEKLRRAFPEATQSATVLISNLEKQDIETDLDALKITFVQKHVAKQTLLPTLLKIIAS